MLNIRGFRSKEISLKKTLKKTKPSMIIMNEIQLSGNMKVKLDSYSCWTRNRSKKGGGGIATAVSREYRDSAMAAGEGQDDDEFLITRIDRFQPALNVINCYGEQRKTKIEEIENKWIRMVKNMEDIRARKEFCILGGDLNKLVGCDEYGVPGNHPEVSPGGQLLRDLLATGNWILVNGLGKEVVKGGPFTRQDPATGNFSCLDLFIISRELRPFFSTMIIDSERKLTIARAIKDKGKFNLVYPDHFPVMINFVDLPKKSEAKEEKRTVWNISKIGGWEKYKDISNEYSETIEKIVDDENLSVQELINKVEKIHDKIKFKSFGKVTLGNKKESEYEKLESDIDDENKAQKLYEDQVKKVEDEIEEIKKLKHGKVRQIWDIRKKIIGGKKSFMEATNIINPITGKLAKGKQEMKEVSLQFCKETLASNKPAEGYEKVINNKINEVNNFLKLSNGNFNPSFSTFENNMRKFKLSRKRNYDFLTRSGEKFQKIIFKVCLRMFKEENFPLQFKDTVLHMIYKGKGRREILSNNRFIHCKSWFARCAEALVVEEGLKDPLIDNSSIYQIGGQPGHRPEELVFVLKSIVARYLSQGKIIIIQCYDIQKYFDKEMIEDGILTCIKRGADPKAIRLWYKLNEDTKIKVKIPGTGLSNPGEVGAVVGQGTIGGALISQAVLDDAVMQHFTPGGQNQLQYGSVPLAPLMFQDDLLNGTEGLDQARIVNSKMDTIMKQHGLSLNQDKSVCLVIGNKEQKIQISKELKLNPLICGNFETKEKQVEKWLGQYLSAEGLADSVHQTVLARLGKIRAASHEIAIIVNDWRSQVVGGMETALQLWESCCISSLLHGAGTWVEVSEQTIKTLNSLQQWFVRLILQVGPGTPLASLQWDFALLDMKIRIWIEKLMLIMYIRNLEEGSLAKIIYKEQKSKNWPGLVEETQDICKKLNIESVHETKLCTKNYRKIVIEASHIANEKLIRDKAKGKTKCNRIIDEEYGKKDYVSRKQINQVRKIFRTKFNMHAFAGNYNHDRRFAKTDWLCRCHKARENEQHLISGECEVFGELRSKFGNLNNLEVLTKFFDAVLKKRDEMDS